MRGLIRGPDSKTQRIWVHTRLGVGVIEHAENVADTCFQVQVRQAFVIVKVIKLPYARTAFCAGIGPLEGANFVETVSCEPNCCGVIAGDI